MRGRPPKPSALRALDGGASHRRDDGRQEPAMPAGSPEPPAHLAPEAKQEFFRLVRWLDQVRGLLGPADHAALGIYCSYYEQWQSAERDLPRLRQRLEEAEDRLHHRKATKAQRAALEKAAGRARNAYNLALGERNKARREMRAYLGELGLTPAARSRIRVDTGQTQLPLGTTPPPNPADPFAAQRAALERGA